MRLGPLGLYVDAQGRTGLQKGREYSSVAEGLVVVLQPRQQVEHAGGQPSVLRGSADGLPATVGIGTYANVHRKRSRIGSRRRICEVNVSMSLLCVLQCTYVI